MVNRMKVMIVDPIAVHAQPLPTNYKNFVYHSSVEKPGDPSLRFTLYRKAYFSIEFKNENGQDYVIKPQELVVLPEDDFKFICVDVVGFDLYHDNSEQRMLQQITAAAKIYEWNEKSKELYIFVYGLLRNPDAANTWSGHIDIALSFYGF